MPVMKPHTLNQGFSVVELMVAVAVLAIIVGIGLPSFQTMLERSRVDSAADSLADSFRYARSEAITRNTTVDVDGPYADGWAVKLDGVDLRVYQAFHGEVNVTNNDAQMSFNGRGMSAESKTFELDFDGGHKRCVEVFLSGLVRQTNDECDE
jgi:type IV fimbrial biogenesis protein FimT